MLKWSIIFLIVSAVAAILGFTEIAGTSLGIAKVLFFVFIILFLITLIAGGALFGAIKK